MLDELSIIQMMSTGRRSTVAMDDAAADHGGLDVLICNAGYARTGDVATSPLDAYSQLLQVNYLGHVHLVKAAVPHLVARKTFVEHAGAVQPAPAPRFSRTPSQIQSAPMEGRIEPAAAVAAWS